MQTEHGAGSLTSEARWDRSLGSASHRLSPGGEIDHRLVVGGGIEPEYRLSLLHLRGDEILEYRHLEGLVGDLVGEMCRDHDHAIAVAEDDVAGEHRRVAATDR